MWVVWMKFRFHIVLPWFSVGGIQVPESSVGPAVRLAIYRFSILSAGLSLYIDSLLQQFWSTVIPSTCSTTSFRCSVSSSFSWWFVCEHNWARIPLCSRNTAAAIRSSCGRRLNKSIPCSSCSENMASIAFRSAWLLNLLHHLNHRCISSQHPLFHHLPWRYKHCLCDI